MAQSGYVYILTNPSTSGIIKIGKTRQNPDERAKALSSSSGMPIPFIVVYQAYFGDYDQAEQFVHSRLDEFRITDNREFFQVAIPVAVDAVLEAKNHFGVGTGDSVNVRDLDQNDFESIDFGVVRESDKGFYELLDIFMNHSMRGWNNFVKSTGLSMPQFSILMQLHYRGAFSVSEVSDRFGITVPAASQLVEKLVQSGYLERAEDPNDRRARLLPLSAKGKRLIEQGFKRRYRWIDVLMSNLREDERKKVVDGLTILCGTAQSAKQE